MRTKEKTLTPRQIKRREAILKAVQTIVKKEGFAGINMRKVAVAASVSPSTLYDIYDSKESLIFYAYEESINNLIKDESNYNPGINRFIKRLGSFADLLTKNPGIAETIAKILFTPSSQTRDNDTPIARGIEARKTSLEEMLSEKELIKNTDIDFYARALNSLTWGTTIHWQAGILTAKEYRKEFIRSSLTVILPACTKPTKAIILETIEKLR